MLGAQGTRDAFFGTGLDASMGSPASTFFGASGSANRAIVINALVKNAVYGVGTGTVQPSPQAAAAVTAEVDALLSRMPSLGTSPTSITVSQATQAACAAVLGSAVVSLQ